MGEWRPLNAQVTKSHGKFQRRFKRLNHTKIYLQRNRTDSNFVAGPVRETIITCLSLYFPLKYYQSFPLQSRFYSLNNTNPCNMERPWEPTKKLSNVGKKGFHSYAKLNTWFALICFDLICMICSLPLYR